MSANKIDHLLDGCFGQRAGLDKGQQVERILEEHHLRPSEVLFVGDSLLDWAFVKDKGVRFLGVRRIFDEQDFRQQGLLSVRDLTDLAQLWEPSPALRSTDEAASLGGSA